MTNQKLWFKAKKYGWGWTPASWEGWLLLLFYLVAIIVFSDRYLLDISSTLSPDRTIKFSIGVLIATIILLYICWKKGEKPRWRWGK